MVTAVFLAIGFLGIAHFLHLLWRRQWTWLGLLIAVGCFAASIVHISIPFSMLTIADYQSNPAVTTPIVWHYGLGYGLLAAVLVIWFQAAMHAAMTPPKRWSAPCLSLVGAWMMFTAGTSFVSHWIETGTLPTLSFNGDLPTWIGFPILFLLGIAPFALAIPWGLVRHPRPNISGTAAILARQWLALGTSLLLVTVIGASFVAGVMGVTGTPGDQTGRVVTLFVFALILVLLGASALVFGLQRTIFNPASAIIEGIKNDSSLDLVVAEGSIWKPVVNSLQATKSELDQSRAQLEALFGHVPVPLNVLSPTGEVVLANNAFAELYGISLAEYLGKKTSELSSFWPEYEQLWELGIAVSESRAPQRIVTPFRCAPNGEDILFDFILFPIANPNGEVVQIGSIAFDITAQSKNSSLIADQREALHQSEKLAALGQLLAGVAHELNNPLTVLVGRSAILAEKLKGTPHESAIADLREAADRSNRIVRTFLAMARQEAPRRRQVQINDAVDAAFDMVAYGIRSAGIEVERKLGPSMRDVATDEDQLVQIFTNLLINAQHALQDHDGPRTLRITTRMDKDSVVAEIADSGPGIPADVASRIFEPFFTTKEVGQGTGMGLSMARGMIEEHGGTLTHSASALGGALFTVRLPLGMAVKSGPVETAPEGAKPAPAGRALVVDDEVSIRRLMVDVLEDDGIECAEAGDGEEALRLLASTHFDLIFSDIRMPGMDGIRFRERIARDHPGMLERLAFMSGDVLQRDTARNASLAGHVIIDKPFNPNQIRQHVSVLLGKGGAAK